MTHFDGDEQHLVEREEHRDLDQHGQAARGRVDLLLLVELHQLLLHLLLVLAVLLAHLDHLGLQLLHLAHRLVGFVGEREEGRLDQHREQEDGDAEVAEPPVELIDGVEDRLGQEGIPAPVDSQVETFDADLVDVPVDKIHLLGADEHPVGHLDVPAGRHPLRGALEIDLVPVDAAAAAVRQQVLVASRERHRLLGHQRDQPVLVGDAEPAAGAVEVLSELVGHTVGSS